MMKLEIEGLCVSLQGSPVLDRLDLGVREGEILALLGPSGCGKSTLLKTIAGLLPTVAGSIRIDGEDYRSRSILWLQAHLGYVLQQPHLFSGTIRENVRFGRLDATDREIEAACRAVPLKMQGVDKKNRRLRVEELLEQIQMTGMADRRISQLSGGQQQRVALARALAAGPRLLLLDEPFSSLDEELRGEMRSLVLRLHREHGMTTVLVTHDKEDARALADRVALMSAGRILRVGAPEELCP